MKQNENPSLPSTIDQHTARLARLFTTLALIAGMIFFVYSAYAGVFLEGGSTQVFIGLVCLILVLGIHVMNENIMLQKQD